MANKIKIATIVGTRPQFIKAALISKTLNKHLYKGKRILKEVLINTGQHYDYEMCLKFFENLKMKYPRYNLGVGSGSHGVQTSKMIVRIEKVLLREKPDCVIVYGDGNSTLAGALVSSKLNIPVSHIEAGLRSFDRSMPEEINRIITDHISQFLFCPTRISVKNLKKEGITKGAYLVGDIMCQLNKMMLKEAHKKSNILKNIGLRPKNYILATVHRQANADIKHNLESIVEAFILSRKPIVFPVHPRTNKMLKKYKLLNMLEKADNIILVEPVGYFDMLVLEYNAEKIITDSGGVQKEAYFMKIPCITLRDCTEWTETLTNSRNVLTGADRGKIIANLNSNIKPGRWSNFYGKSNVAEKIVDILKMNLF